MRDPKHAVLDGVAWLVLLLAVDGISSVMTGCFVCTDKDPGCFSNTRAALDRYKKLCSNSADQCATVFVQPGSTTYQGTDQTYGDTPEADLTGLMLRRYCHPHNDNMQLWPLLFEFIPNSSVIGIGCNFDDYCNGYNPEDSVVANFPDVQKAMIADIASAAAQQDDADALAAANAKAAADAAQAAADAVAAFAQVTALTAVEAAKVAADNVADDAAAAASAVRIAISGMRAASTASATAQGTTNQTQADQAAVDAADAANRADGAAVSAKSAADRAKAHAANAQKAADNVLNATNSVQENAALSAAGAAVQASANKAFASAKAAGDSATNAQAAANQAHADADSALNAASALVVPTDSSAKDQAATNQDNADQSDQADQTAGDQASEDSDADIVVRSGSLTGTAVQKSIGLKILVAQIVWVMLYSAVYKGFR